MTDTRKLLHNISFQMVTQATTWILTWVFTITIPRYLGDDGFGRLFFALSISMVFGVLSDLGINTYLLKEVSRDRQGAPRLLANVLAIKGVLAVLLYGALVVAVRFLNLEPETVTVTYVVGISYLVGSMGLTLASFSQGLELPSMPARALILDKALVTVFSVSALALGYGLVAVAWVFLLGSLASTGYMASRLYRMVPFGLSLDGAEARRILKGAAPFLIWIVFSEIYIRVDVLMLNQMTSDSVVGWYGAAFRLYCALLFIPNIFMITVFPVLSRKFAESGESAIIASRRSLNFTLLVAVPIGMGTMLVARPVVGLLFDMSQFSHTVENLEIFGLSMIFVCVDVVLGSVLIANDKQRQWSYCAIGAAGLNLGLNAWLIPRFQAYMGNGGCGAALATLLTEVFMLVCALGLMPAGIFDRSNLITAFKACLAGLLMTAVVGAVPGLGLVGMILVGGATFVAAALLLRVVPREDTAHIKHAILGRI